MLERGANTVVVFDSQGQELPDVHAGLSGYSDRTLLIHLGSELPDEGDVSIRWTVHSKTGEISSGDISFVIGDEVGDAHIDADQAVISEPRSSESIVLWTIAMRTP